MEACIPVLISAAATLGLIALGIALVILAPLPSSIDGHKKIREPDPNEGLDK